MKILVFGSTGMLGKAILKEANNRKISVFGASRNDADIIVDVRQISDIVNAVNIVKPEVIINAAAIVNLDECERDPGKAYMVNTRPAAILADIASRRGMYFIQISTDHYYNGDGDMLHNEVSPVQLLNEYARSKYAAEKFALTSTNSLVVRTNIVGFRNGKNLTFVEWVIQSLNCKREMILFDDFYTSSITVQQLAQILFKIIELKPYGVLNIASKGAYSKKTFIEYLAKRLGLELNNPKCGSVHSSSQLTRGDSLGLDVSQVEAIIREQMPDLHHVVDSLITEYVGCENGI